MSIEVKPHPIRKYGLASITVETIDLMAFQNAKINKVARENMAKNIVVSRGLLTVIAIVAFVPVVNNASRAKPATDPTIGHRLEYQRRLRDLGTPDDTDDEW